MSWPVVKIDEISELVTKGTTPTTYGMPFTDEGINFIKAESLNGDTSLNRSGFTYVSEDTHNKLSRSILQVNDVLLTIAGANVGACGFVTENDIPANTNQAVSLIRIIPEKANPRFIYYYFKRPQMKALCLNIGGQSAQPNVNLGNVKNFDVPLPAIGIQNKIVEVLSAYDDLIENNRRRIALLEESARLLYREWFVHLRFPGHEATKIIDGVPEEWSSLPASEAIQVNPKTDWDKSKQIRSIPMAALSESQMVVDKSLYELREKPTSIKFRNEDTLFARITPCLENGKTGYVNFLKENEVACGSTEFIVLRSNKISKYAVYLLAREEGFRKNAIVSMVGSSGRQRVQPSCFDKYTVLVPSENIADLFDKIVSVFFGQIRVLDDKNDALTKARDHLLPRLMDGRVEL